MRKIYSKAPVIANKSAPWYGKPHPPSPVGLGLPDEPQRRRIVASPCSSQSRWRDSPRWTKALWLPLMRELSSAARLRERPSTLQLKRFSLPQPQFANW